MVSSTMQHFETHCILNDNQHGTQLLEFMEELTTSLEGGRQADIIILDFAKAFDRVNHSLLVHKIHQGYGIRGSTITWIANFLSDRRQAVVIDGSCSAFVESDQEYLRGPFLAPVSFWPTLMTCQRS